MQTIFKNETLRTTLTRGFVFVMIAMTLLMPVAPAFAATYTFTQTNWGGGASATTASHPTNETGWTNYASKDSSTAVVNGGADVQLSATNASTTQTTDVDFNAGATSSAIVSGTSTAANVQLTKLGGANTWTTLASTPVAVNNGGALTYDGNGNMYAFGGNGTVNFWKYNIASNSWTAMANALAVVQGGGSLVYDGNGNIYALGGNQSIAFWKYNIASNSWTTMANALAAVNFGGDLAYDGNGNIYAFQGNNTTAFWKYNIASNSWTVMANALANVYTGGALTYDGNGNVYAFQGSNTTAFWKYNIASNSWTAMAATPGGTTWDSSLTYDGNGNIYAFEGNNANTFWKYNIIANSWTTLTTPPTNAASNGGVLTYDGNGNIYALRGYGTMFVKYSIYDSYTSSGTFESATIDMGQKATLGSLTFNPGTTPTASGTLQYQLATSDASSGPWTYVGSDGTAATYFTTTGMATPAALNGHRYTRYKAFFTGGGSGWNTLANTPAATNAGGASIYDDNGNIYRLQGGSGTGFWKYTIASSTWSTMAITPAAVASGGSLAYDGNGNVYAFRGNTTTDFWKYAVATNAWTTMAATPAAVASGGSLAYDNNGNIYGLGGNGTLNFWKYSIASSTWSTMANTPGDTSAGSMTYDGNGNIYAFRGYGAGNYTNNFWKYNIAANTWTVMTVAPATEGNGALAYDSNGNIYAFRGYAGSGSTAFWKYNIASSTWSIMTNTPSGVSGGSSLAYDNVGNIYGTPGFGTASFWKYSTLSSATPILNDITLNYSAYPANQTLTSSPYNATDVANILSKLQWTSSLPAGTDAKFQLRSSPDNITWTGWMGPNGTSSTYFTDLTGGDAMPAALKTNSQWFQYKLFLSSDGISTPTLSDVTTTYVVNAPPEFSPAATTTALQSSTSTDPNWGKVSIGYSVRDTDTTSGSFTPGFVTPSFEYNIGSGWLPIASSSLAIGDTANKAVSTSAFTPYTATWDAKSQIPEIYTATAQVRVTASDNEAANAIAQSTSNAFLIDTKKPTQTVTAEQGMNAIYSYAGADNSAIRYLISNSPTLGSDGQNPASGQWVTANATSTAASSTWIFPTMDYPVIYAQTQDIYGNTASSSAVVPIKPVNFDLKDVSNVLNGEYREFISWKAYVATTSATFSRYELYRSTDGNTYQLHSTITNPATNYYNDLNLATTTTYYYRMKTIDSDGDISAWSNIISDLPDGQGGTDVTAPKITSVTVADTQATWAKVIVDTDEFTFVTVEYGPTGGTPYASSKSDNSIGTEHTIVLSNLTPQTGYTFRIKAHDILDNTSTDDNHGSGYAIGTVQGPVISAVAVQLTDDKNATVVWNTDKDSDSSVTYATNIADLNAGTNTVTVADTGLVGGPPYQHRLVLPNLSPRTTYFFSVQSSDASGNISVDKNNLSYYTFATTYDTKPPVISKLLTPVITESAIVVLWSTDELSDSQISYGPISGVYATSTALDPIQSITHAVTLTGLDANTKYYFTVTSKDSAGNQSVSEEKSAKTTNPGEVKVITVGGGSGEGANNNPAPELKDTTPPTISNIQVASTTAFTATISFDTNEPTVAFVDYGKDVTYGLAVGSENFVTHHEVSLGGLRIGTDYHYKIKALDKASNATIGDDQTFKTKFVSETGDNLTTIADIRQYEQISQDSIESILPSIRPPFVEKAQVSDVTEDSATISWRTNIKAYGVVSYATDEDFTKTASSTTPYTGEVSDTNTKTIDHSLALVGLKPDTKYHFKVKSFSLPQVIGEGTDITFTTKASRVAAQVIGIKNTSFNVIWTTADAASTIVEYKNVKNGEIQRKIDNNQVKEHDMLIDKLLPATTYEVTVFGYNANNNLVEGGSAITVSTVKDITAPKISNFKVDGALVPGRTDRVQTVITWITDEPSNSSVFYQEGAGAVTKEFANKSTQLDTYTTNHAVILSNLKPGTIYQMKVESSDQAGNKATFGPRTIITPQKGESIFDVIFKNFEDTFKFLRSAGQ